MPYTCLPSLFTPSPVPYTCLPSLFTPSLCLTPVYHPCLPHPLCLTPVSHPWVPCSQARSENVDPLSNELEDEEEEEPRGNMDTYWSERDRQVLAPCGGLMKTAAACLKKLSAAVKASGSVATPQTVAQLDDLADVTKMISPGVDDLALSLYPPMDYSGVENNACQLASILKKVLEIIRSSHVCLEADLTWVQFLERAVEHNLHKIQDLVQVSI
ncbi:cyclin-D1-binding protein 1 homolog [Hypomesus transpacificus]|uniref:cyclin-D1-binding protein 1 homolog n=1 Tax=Hypomesus transpacificus TaxID=137520 RepID=UPI001F073657|nr:cyclin-D1-binding protein 1 homolog [Hypomesus transpacificus]